MICIPSESHTVVRKQIEITTSREFTSKEWLEKVVSSSLPSEKKTAGVMLGQSFYLSMPKISRLDGPSILAHPFLNAK